MTALRSLQRARAERGRRAAGDGGFTLAEMMVTVMLIGLLATMVAALVINASRSFTLDRAANDNTAIASNGMNELTRVIRAGTETRVSASEPLNNPVFLAIGKESMTLRAYLDTDSANPQPIVVRFQVDADRKLYEKRWKANASSEPYWTFQNLPGGLSGPYSAASSFWTNPASDRLIAQMITPQAAGQPAVFTYFTKDGVEVDPGAAGVVDKTVLRTIASVTVTLSVQTDLTTRADPVVIQNSVGIPNLGISRVGA